MTEIISIKTAIVLPQQNQSIGQTEGADDVVSQQFAEIHQWNIRDQNHVNRFGWLQQVQKQSADGQVTSEAHPEWWGLCNYAHNCLAQ